MSLMADNSSAIERKALRKYRRSILACCFGSDTMEAHHFGVDLYQASEPTAWLLQLPGVALGLVLQKLDQCSLASTAASCWQLSSEVPAYQSSVVVRCRPVDSTGVSETFDSFTLRLAQDSTSLNHLTQCRIVGDVTNRIPQLILRSLPCPQLRHLHLRGLRLQLDGCPGALYECSGLTALALQSCALDEMSDPFTVIAALPELQHFTVEATQYVLGDLSRFPFGQLQQPSKLTHLSIQSYELNQRILPEQLEQLSEMVNLKHLHLGDVPNDGVPGGVPSQLQQLTTLELSFCERCDVAEQLQHISSLTALQQLAVKQECLAAEDLSGIRDLPQLTHLEIQCCSWPIPFTFSTASTGLWACLTALQSLNLKACIVQPAALARLTQLRALSLRVGALFEDADLDDLLDAVSKMSQLSHLQLSPGMACPREGQTTSASAFTALTASTHLRSLQLVWPTFSPLDEYVLFQPGHMYPHLRHVTLQYDAYSRQGWPDLLPLSDQQIAQLPSCCPAVEHLDFRLRRNSPAAALPPLLQLSALTRLGLSWHHELAPALEFVAQLTGLKQLHLQGFLKIADPVLQLTTLTALEKLVVHPLNTAAVLIIENKARWCSPPDVCLQLLRELPRFQVDVQDSRFAT